MADNVILPGTGSSVASDDIGGHQYQRVKISIGDSGAATDLGPGQELMAASVPVVIASNQSSIPVAGVAADDAAASGNPVMIGGKYLATPDILLADGDVGSARITQRRALRVVNDKATVTEYDEMPADGDAFDLYPTLRKALKDLSSASSTTWTWRSPSTHTKWRMQTR